MLIVTASYPPVLGGLQTVTSRLAVYERCLGMDVKVLTNRYPRSLPPNEPIDDIPVCRLQFMVPKFQNIRRGRFDLFLAALYFKPAVERQLERLFHQWRPEVVNYHFPLSHITPFVLKLREKVRFRLVVSLHGHDVLSYADLTSVERRLFICLLRTADKITVCSDYLKKRLLEIDPTVSSRVTVIHNGVDLSRFAIRSAFQHHRPYLFSFARLVRAKGTDLLVEAFTQCAQEFPDVDLIVAGDGEEKEQLEHMVRENAMTERIQFVGRATPDEIVQYLNGSLFTVFARRDEPFGIAVLEAMAAGKPVIATRVGGLPEILDAPPNQLVQPTVSDISHAMRVWLSGDVDLQRIGAMNTARASRFDWSVSMAQYSHLLNRGTT